MLRVNGHIVSDLVPSSQKIFKHIKFALKNPIWEEEPSENLT